MRGLIAAALGGVSKGVGDVASTQIEVNAKKALMEAEEEMRARLAEASESRAEARQIAKEERDIGNIGRVYEAQAGAEEDVMRRRFGEGSEYAGLLGSQMSATETPSQRVAREAAELSLEDQRELSALNRQIADAADPAERTKLVERRNALFGAPEAKLDPATASRQKMLETGFEKAIDEYYKALGENDEDRAERIRQDMTGIAAELDSLFGGRAQPAGAAQKLPENEIPGAVASAVEDLRSAATPADREEILAMADQLGIKEQVIQAMAPARTAELPAAAAAAAPAAAPREFEGYRVPASTVGGLLSQNIVEPIAGAVSRATTLGPEAQARVAAGKVSGQTSLQENAARSVMQEMQDQKLPSIATKGDRERVEAALASGLLPPEYAETLRRYLAQSAQ